MKISDRNIALHFLGATGEINFYLPESNKNLTPEKQREFADSVKGALKNASEGLFSEKMRFLSRPFLEAFALGRSRLIDVFDKEPIEETGTFITIEGSYTHTYFYYLKTYGEGDTWGYDIALLVFTKHSHSDSFGLDVCVIETRETSKTFIWKTWEDGGLDAKWWAAWLVTLLCFIKYCPLETKIVNAGRKEHHAGEKYKNETARNIEILDSTWFTTIIRSEGFGVKGHFRMQPFGTALSQRKLIWIAPFEKEGYTRTAKIINHQDTVK